MGFRSGEYAGRYSSLIPLLTRSMRASKEREVDSLRLNDLPNPATLWITQLSMTTTEFRAGKGCILRTRSDTKEANRSPFERTLNDHAFDYAIVEGDCGQDRVPAILSEDSKSDRLRLTFCPGQSIVSCMHEVLPWPKPGSSSMSSCCKRSRRQRPAVPACSSRQFEDDTPRGPIRYALQHAS